MFELFHALLYNTDQIKKPYPTEPLFFELDNNDYTNLTGTFKKTYPNIHEGLENYWKDMNSYWLLQSLDLKESFGRKKIECDRNWQKVNIFKLKGNYYHCRKCNNAITKFQLQKMKDHEPNHGSKVDI